MPCSVVNATNSCNIPMKIVKFPAGETLVNLELNGYVGGARDRIVVTMQYKGADDIMNLCQIADILQGRNWHLYIPYVPYARQDRRANTGDSHSLRVFADLVNNLGAVSIQIDDPHSDVVEALFPHAGINRQWNIASDFIMSESCGPYDVIIAPDQGAVKKAAMLAEMSNTPLVSCTKKRDPVTGKLSSPKIQDSSIFKEGNRVLVVDDICDGGYTFIQLIAALDAELQVEIHVDLFVTHGIFSKGIDVLKEAGYSNVYCYNKIYEWN